MCPRLFATFCLLRCSPARPPALGPSFRLSSDRLGQTYEYAMAQGPGQEAHGGSTYCSIAALLLMGFLDHLPHQDKLVRWLLERQITGFQGDT